MPAFVLLLSLVLSVSCVVAQEINRQVSDVLTLQHQDPTAFYREARRQLPDLPEEQQLLLLPAIIETAMDLGEEEQVQQLFITFENRVKNAPTTQHLARLAELKGDRLRLKTQYQAAEQVYRQALILYKQIDDTQAIAATYRAIGICLRNQSRYVQAIEILESALSYYLEGELIDDAQGLADTYNSLGTLYEQIAQYESALQFHFQSLKIKRELDDRPGIASSLFNIGEVYRELEDLNAAQQYLLQAYQLDKAHGEKRNIAFSANLLGQIAFQLGQWESASAYNREAITLFTALNAKDNLAWAMTQSVRLALSQKNITEAQQRLAQALSYSAPLSVQYFKLKLLEVELALAQTHYKEAIDKAKVLQASIPDNKPDDKATLYRLLARAYIAIEAYPHAIDALQQQLTINQVLFDTRRTRNLARIQSNISFIEKERQIAELKKDQVLERISNEQESFKRKVRIASGLALALLCISLYLRLHQKRANVKLSVQVKEQTQALSDKHQALQEAYAELKAISQQDQLTGLHNRHYLYAHIERDIQDCLRQHRDKVDKPSDFIFFLIDLDHFKHINDQFGHPGGDAVLMAMKELLNKVFRQSDYLIRWGGEEFLVITRHTQRQHANQLAERLRMEVANHDFVMEKGPPQRLTCSIGYAPFPFLPHDADAYPWSDILVLADKALYAAKHSQRNAWVGLTAGDKEFGQTLSNLLIPDAIAARQLKLHTSISGPLSWKVE